MNVRFAYPVGMHPDGSTAILGCWWCFKVFDVPDWTGQSQTLAALRCEHCGGWLCIHRHSALRGTPK